MSPSVKEPSAPIGNLTWLGLGGGWQLVDARGNNVLGFAAKKIVHLKVGITIALAEKGWLFFDCPKVSTTINLAANSNELFYGNVLVGIAFSPNYGAGWTVSNGGISILGHPDISGIGIFGNYVIAANDQGLYRSPLP